MINTLHLSVGQIIRYSYWLGVLFAYFSIRHMNRNATKGKEHFGSYTYGHVVLNIVLAFGSWGTMLIASFVWLANHEFRTHIKPPKWL